MALPVKVQKIPLIHGLLLLFLICDVIQFVDGDDASNKQNIEPNETNDLLHRNDSHHADNIDDANNLIFLIY